MITFIEKICLTGWLRFFILWFTVLCIALLSFRIQINDGTISHKENCIFDYI